MAIENDPCVIENGQGKNGASKPAVYVQKPINRDSPKNDHSLLIFEFTRVTIPYFDPIFSAFTYLSALLPLPLS